ncbi:MAG: hypothetical protein ACP5VR_02210 [Acidimicrobiales bacterium]
MPAAAPGHLAAGNVGRRMGKGEFGSAGHLAARFFTALWPKGPSAIDEAWALASLLPGEQQLWRRMSGPDRRHGIVVARRTERALVGSGTPVPREVLAAALLHDVGKVEARLGTFARVGVTLAAIVVGRKRLLTCPSHGVARDLRRRVALYLAHDQVGAGLLRQAGSDWLTATWAEQHHLSPGAWALDMSVARALKAADGD